MPGRPGVAAVVLALAGSLLVPTPAAEAQGDPAASERGLAVGEPREAAGSKPAPETWLIIDLDIDPLASYDGRIPGLPATSPRVTGSRRLDRASPRARQYLAFVDGRQRAFERRLRDAIPGAAVAQRYDLVLGGAAVRVPAGHEQQVAQLPGVRGVHPVERLPLLTDSTPALVGADELWGRLGGQGMAGEGIVVGVVDSGLWPEHPSFADPDPAGLAFPPPPPGWNPEALCEFGATEHNPLDVPFDCNGKLLAAYNFQDTYRQQVGITPQEYDSARDADGHGTHVASTAAGNGGVVAGALGTVSGIAPRAHVAVYKACGRSGCYSSDTVAAINQAVHDGVDVINYSVAGGADPYADPVSAAFLDAFEAGVVVVAAAGNGGPAPGSVNHLQPWTITVAATTTARTFTTTLSLASTDGPDLEIAGSSSTPGLVEPASVVRAADAAQDVLNPSSVTAARRCLDPFEPGTFGGAVVVCESGGIPAHQKGVHVLAGGAAAMVLYEAGGGEAGLDNHALPVVHLVQDGGISLLDYLDVNTDVVGSFPDPVATPVGGDLVPSFSGRGNPLGGLGVAKPDVAAPGVGVLAGHTPEPASGPRGFQFRVARGTSMATPHVTGAAALLRQAHPDWSPAQVRSALMLTGLTEGVGTTGGGQAGPFDVGSGRIRPAVAEAAGLTMDETRDRYVELRDRLWEVNHPSVFVPDGADVVALERRFTDATGSGGTWTITVEAPDGVSVSAPAELLVPNGGSATLPLEFRLTALEPGDVRHGGIVLERDGQRLRLPITVRKGHPDLDLAVGCTPVTLAWGAKAGCTATLTNAGPAGRQADLAVDLPANLKVVPGSVSGGTLDGSTIRFQGSLPGSPPDVVANRQDGASPFGYLPLAGFGIGPLPALGDEAVINVTLEPQRPAFEFGGIAYRTFGVVSNGYVVLGGGEAADVAYVNTNLPSPHRPNNVLAPFWTDLDPSKGGTISAGVVDSGPHQWLVVEWAGVPHYADASRKQSFQVWMGLTASDIAYFTYGEVSGGNNGLLTVGAENPVGTSGNAVHFNGFGPQPSATAVTGYTVAVTAQAGPPPPPHTVSFQVEGLGTGTWEVTGVLGSDGFAGVLVRGLAGTVVPIVPGAPGNLKVTGGDRRIDASWSAATNGGSTVTAYRVTASPGGHQIDLPPTARSAALTGLGAGTTYTVSVRARNAVGLGPAAQASATTAPLPEPTPTPTPSPTPTGTPPGTAQAEVQRVAGLHRFATAAAVSASTFSPGVPVAYVATGANFPDALAGSAVAGFRGGPVLLTLGSGLPEETRKELTRLKPQRVVALGGESVISQAVLVELRRLAPVVERVAGPDRFATAAAVSASTFSPGVPVAYVATGANFPDALAGSAAAAAAGGPVLLTNPRTLPDATAAELVRLRPGRIVVLGGVNAVSAAVLAELSRYAPVTRLAGPDRFATAAATALDAFSSADVVYVATGSDYPDALAGSAAAALAGGPVLLVQQAGVPPATAEALDVLDPARVVVLGGVKAVSDATLVMLRH